MVRHLPNLPFGSAQTASTGRARCVLLKSNGTKARIAGLLTYAPQSDHGRDLVSSGRVTTRFDVLK